MSLLGTDFFNLESRFTQSQKSKRDKVKLFVNEHVSPHIAEWFENGIFPEEMPKKLAQLDLLGPLYYTPKLKCEKEKEKEKENTPWDSFSLGLAMQELERGDSAIRSFASVQGSLVMFPIANFGTPAQQDRWLPALSQGLSIGAFGLTEPQGGSNPAHMQTVARRSGDDWILSGVKTWITNAPIADVAIIWAQTESGIQGFLVERGTPGFSTHAIDHKISMRASATGMFVLDACRVSDDARLPGATGLKSILRCLNEARYTVIWGAIGAGGDAFSEALEFVKKRNLFSKRLAEFQLTQAKIAEMTSLLATSQLIAFELAQKKEENSIQAPQISLAKWKNVESARTITRLAREILGASGVSIHSRSMRHLCNLESLITYEGTSEIHILAIGQHITGISAFE